MVGVEGGLAPKERCLPLGGASRRVVQIRVRELGACIDIGRRLERGNVSRGRASALSNGSGKESGREVLVQARCIPRHFLTSSSSSSPGASRVRSGWSGGRAGSKGAVPPLLQGAVFGYATPCQVRSVSRRWSGWRGGRAGSQGAVPFLLECWRACLLPAPILIVIFFWRFARAEWLE